MRVGLYHDANMVVTPTGDVGLATSIEGHQHDAVEPAVKRLNGKIGGRAYVTM
jgi:hypothetical protein